MKSEQTVTGQAAAMTPDPTLFDPPDESLLPRHGPRPRHALVIDQYQVKAPQYPRDAEWWQRFVGAVDGVVTIDDQDQVTIIADARLNRWCAKPPRQASYDSDWKRLYTKFTRPPLAKYFDEALTVEDLP